MFNRTVTFFQPVVVFSGSCNVLYEPLISTYVCSRHTQNLCTLANAFISDHYTNLEWSVTRAPGMYSSWLPSGRMHTMQALDSNQSALTCPSPPTNYLVFFEVLPRIVECWPCMCSFTWYVCWPLVSWQPEWKTPPGYYTQVKPHLVCKSLLLFCTFQCWVWPANSCIIPPAIVT